jgi:hypothetical protein
VGSIIGIIAISIAIVCFIICTLFLVAFYEMDSPVLSGEFPNNFFESIHCEREWMENTLGILLVVLVIAGVIGGLML